MYEPRTITKEIAENAIRSHDISIIDKADRLLQYIASSCNFVGEKFKISLDNFNVELLAKCWIQDYQEFYGFIEYLKDRQFIKTVSDSQCCIALNGWQRIDELSKKHSENSQCFIAMWFDSSMDGIYQTIKTAVNESGYKICRVDQLNHINKIDDIIIKEIRNSKFVIVDATNKNAGAYFEAGFALGLGLDIIWTAKSSDDLHFDIRQYNCLFWGDGNMDGFKENLKNRILANFGNGPDKI